MYDVFEKFVKRGLNCNVQLLDISILRNGAWRTWFNLRIVRLMGLKIIIIHKYSNYDIKKEKNIRYTMIISVIKDTRTSYYINPPFRSGAIINLILM